MLHEENDRPKYKKSSIACSRNATPPALTCSAQKPNQAILLMLYHSLDLNTTDGDRFLHYEWISE